MFNLLNCNNQAFKILMSFLDHKEILILKTVHGQKIDKKTQMEMEDYIHFKKYINFDHTLNLMWGYTNEDSMGNENSVIVTQSRIHLENAQTMIRKTSSLVRALEGTLSLILSVNCSSDITNRVFQAFRESPMIIPALRREEVGFNTNTPLQYYYADRRCQENDMECLDFEYRLEREKIETEVEREYNKENIPRESLKTKEETDRRISKKHTHESIAQLNKIVIRNFTKLVEGYDKNLEKMRVLVYQPQTITEFNKTGCILIDLINLILVISRNHAEQVRCYLDEIPNSTEKMLYYLSFFSNFRKTAIWLDSRMGYLMECLNSLIQKEYSHLQYAPPSNFVVPIVKIWYTVMKDLQRQFDRIFICLVIRYREDIVQKFLKKMNIDNNLLIKWEQTGSFYDQLKKEIMLQGTFLSKLQKIPAALKYNISIYKEYLVDLSVNEESVCFNNHSTQRMGHVYNQMESQLLHISNKFYDYLRKKYGSLQIVSKFMKRDSEACNFILRPNTTKKIIQQMNNYLDEWKKSTLSLQELNSCVSVCIDFGQEDHRIKIMNNCMNISMVDKPELDFIMDISQTVDLEELDRIFKTIEELQEEDD